MEINFVFNSQSTYYNDFLKNFRFHISTFYELNFSEEDFLSYSNAEMDVLIDNNGTVYITVNSKDSKELNELISKVVKEYYFLSSIEEKFSTKTEMKIFLPKKDFGDVPYRSFKFPFFTSVLKNDVALTMSLAK